ncbi:MAG: GNAT family N-acetyltransferase [Janthinobacterium lividum]
METGTRAIVELAWARRLGLPDDALEPGTSWRLTRSDDSVAMFVSLWEHRVLVGPDWLLERAEGVDDHELASGPGLLGLTARTPDGAAPGRLLGAGILSFSDVYVEHDQLESVVVADDPQAVHDLERQCPPDDVTEVGLGGLGERFVLLDDREAPDAGSGYDEWQGILANVGVLVPPALRRGRRGTLAGAMATNDALDSGLVPQWRCRSENVAALGLARRLGYEMVGTQTTVALTAAPDPV